MLHRNQTRRQSAVNSCKKELLEAEVERLREELKRANIEKNEISSEYEKLSTICKSQRQQLRGIKQALASTTPTPNKTDFKLQSSPEVQQQGLINIRSSKIDQNSWQVFPEDFKTPTLVMSDDSKPVTTRNSHQNKSAAARSLVHAPVTNLKQSHCFGGSRNNERNSSSQPPGWAAF